MLGVPPFATLVPGADWSLNDRRRQGVRSVVLHTTEGTDSRGLGEQRHHSTPGTFNFLNRDEALYCYYPAYVRCTHAAGGNGSPGVENEGFTGRPLTPNQVANLGRLIDWFDAEYDVPPVYKCDDPRIWLDQTTYRGFIAHRAVDYPPDTSLRHYNLITPEEFARAAGNPPPPVPLPDLIDSLEDVMMLCENFDEPGRFYIVTTAGILDCPPQEAVRIRTQKRMVDVDKVGAWVLRMWDKQLRGLDRPTFNG